MNRLFIFFIMLAVFFVTGEYGITRPASQALLITHYSSAILPWIWLATIPFNLTAISLYNRFLSKWGPVKMLALIAGLTIVINGFSGLFTPFFPSLILFQFAWKDIYVILMLTQVWSLIHSTIPSAKAKYLYGVIYGVGTLGSVLGSLIPGFFATRLGSESLFFFTLPAYLLLFFFYRKAFLHSSFKSVDIKTHDSFSMVYRTPILLAIMLLVVLMQMSVGLMEFQFNLHLEQNIVAKDLRTEYVGQMMTYVNLLSGFFQIVGSMIMIRFFGVLGSHTLIPLFLLTNAALLLFMPSFALISFAFVFIKAVDFSLFGVMREMLYVPLKLDEKYRAKAVIDVFAYRSSKALISLSIIGLQFFPAITILPALSVAILAIWLGTVWFFLKKHHTQSIIS